MQDILAELFWNHEEISRKADQFCQTLPGYSSTKQEYDSIAEKVKNIVGYDLYDELYTLFMRCTDYEIYSYYSFGLGLREEVARALRL